MSKGSLFWGNASGKLGEVVNYRAGGEQRARTYVAKIKNPRTLAQMKNRVALNNVVSAFHAMKSLLQTTFPTRKKNQSAFNSFVQANKNRDPYFIMKSDIEAQSFVPFGLVISKGSLGINTYPVLKSFTNESDREASLKYGYSIQGLLNLDGFKMKVSADRDVSYDMLLSVEELTEVFSKCCVTALPSEFQVTSIIAANGDNVPDSETALWKAAYRVHHCQTYGAYAQSYGVQGVSQYMNISLHVATKSEPDADGMVELTFDDLIVGSLWATAEDVSQNSAAIILSFRDSSGIQVSNTSLSGVIRSVGVDRLPNIAGTYQYGGVYAMQAIESYGYKANDIMTSNVDNLPPVEEDTDDEEDGGGEELE